MTVRDLRALLSPVCTLHSLPIVYSTTREHLVEGERIHACIVAVLGAFTSGRSLTQRTYIPTVDETGRFLRFETRVTSMPLAKAFKIGWRGGDRVALSCWQPSDAAVVGAIDHDLTTPDSVRRTADAMLAALRRETACASPSVDAARGLERDLDTLAKALQQLRREWPDDCVDRSERLAELAAPLNALVADTSKVIAAPVVVPDLAADMPQADVIAACEACIAPLVASATEVRSSVRSAQRRICVDSVTWAISATETMSETPVDLDAVVRDRPPLRLPKAQGRLADLHNVPGTRWEENRGDLDFASLHIDSASSVATVVERLHQMAHNFHELAVSPLVLGRARTLYTAVQELSATVTTLRRMCTADVSHAVALQAAVYDLRARLADLGAIAPVRRKVDDLDPAAWVSAWPTASNVASVTTKCNPGSATMALVAVSSGLAASLQALNLFLEAERAAAERTLSLAMGSSGVEMCTAIARIDDELQPLRTLDVQNRGIDEAAMQALEPAFAHLTQLRELYLNTNPLAAGGYRILARGLCHTRMLETLDLMSTQLDEAGMRALEPAFPHLSRLTWLRLYGNPISPAVAASLARCLQHTPALLNLIMSNLAAGSLQTLEPAFAHIPRLTYLYVGAIDGENGAALLRCLAHTRQLTSLYAKLPYGSTQTITQGDIQAAVPAGCKV